MRNGIRVGLLASAALAGGAFYWIHLKSERTQDALASASEPVTPETADKDDRSADKGNESSSAGELKKTEAPPEPGIALRSGEILEFAADVANLSKVANLRLQVAERRNFEGKQAWHLQAFAHTENPLRMVFELDDQFDSYSDAFTLSSLQYEMHLSERGQKVESVQRMTTTAKETAPANVTETRVLPGTRDPLGLMQFLRNVDWHGTREVRGPVYDGHKLYDVRAAVANASEAVTVPAGSYKATKIDLRVFENGTELKDARFTLYLANNAAHTPVLLEAVMPFATARVQLVKIK